MTAYRNPDQPPCEPVGWLVLRPEVRTSVVGPFASEAEATAWQEADCTAHGDCEWSTWPLYSVEGAAADATAADATS